MSWYNKIDKKARGNSPVMDHPAPGSPYIRSKPGDQNGDKPVTDRATHGLGDSGYGGHSRTDDRNVGQVGIQNDDHEDTVPEFGGSHDYGKGTGESDGKGNSDLNSRPWFSDNDPNGPTQYMLNNLPDSDNLDKHPSMLGSMNDGGYQGEVFDEIRQKRKK